MPDEDDDEDVDPEEAEREISAFIASAELLSGPAVTELADAVLQVLRVAWDDINVLMADVPLDKLLATMLDVGQRARADAPDDPSHWHAHAASSLLSGMVGLRRRS
jgi:hypothetical protein